MDELAARLSVVTASPQEHCGQRVITLAQMDAVHGRPRGTARRNFNKHRAKFREGIDFFETREADEIRTLGVVRPQGGTAEKTILLTESGYLLLVKTFRDPLAWQVQRRMIDVYFRAKAFAGSLPSSTDVVQLVPATRDDVQGLRAEVKALGETVGGRFDSVDHQFELIKGDLTCITVAIAGERKEYEPWAFRWWGQTAVRFYRAPDGGGMCPKCRENQIVDAFGECIPGAAQGDHFKSRNYNHPDGGWLICVPCHRGLGEPGLGNPKRREALEAFNFFQQAMKQMGQPSAQTKKLLEREAAGQGQLNLSFTKLS